MGVLEAGPVAPAGVDLGQAAAAQGREFGGFDDHLLVEGFHLRDQLDLLGVSTARVGQAQREEPDQLAIVTPRGEVGENARPGVLLEPYDVRDGEPGFVHRLGQHRLQERYVEVGGAEPVDPMTPPESLVRISELTARNGSQGGDVEREREAADDLGEPLHPVVARTPERSQVVALLPQPGTTTNRPDHEVRQQQRHPQPVPLRFRREDRGPRLVHTRDVLAGGNEESRDHVGRVDVEADRPSSQAPRGRDPAGPVDRLGRRLQHLLDGRAIEYRLGGDPGTPARARVQLGELLVAAHVRLDHEPSRPQPRHHRELVVDPLASAPSRRGGHVLPTGIGSLIYEPQVDHSPDLHRIQLHQLRVRRHRSDLALQLSPLPNDPLRKPSSSPDALELEPRRPHHPLEQHPGLHPTRP